MEEINQEQVHQFESSVGWVKLFRSFTKWEWWEDHNTSRLFIWLLTNVNFEEKKWKGIVVQSGQILTGRKSLSEKTGLSEQQIRTCLEKLQLTKEITIESLGFSSRISIVNWEKYQTSTNESTKQQPSGNQVVTKGQPPLKNEKNVKKDKNINTIEKNPEFPLIEQLDDLCDESKEMASKINPTWQKKLIARYPISVLDEEFMNMGEWLLNKNVKKKCYEAFARKWVAKHHGDDYIDPEAQKLSNRNMEKLEQEHLKLLKEKQGELPNV